MEISLFSAIFLYVINLIILYLIIETAVRKGIDGSKTTIMIEEYIKKKMEEKDEH